MPYLKKEYEKQFKGSKESNDIIYFNSEDEKNEEKHQSNDDGESSNDKISENNENFHENSQIQPIETKNEIQKSEEFLIFNLKYINTSLLDNQQVIVQLDNF